MNTVRGPPKYQHGEHAFANHLFSLLDLMDDKALVPGVLPVTKKDHSLQCATLAVQAGKCDEYIFMCLFHDIGDSLSNLRHPYISSELLQPYLGQKLNFVLRFHQLVQGRTFFSDYGMDPSLYDTLPDHPWFPDLLEFVDKFDDPAFDPDAKNVMTVEDFRPLVQRWVALREDVATIQVVFTMRAIADAKAIIHQSDEHELSEFLGWCSDNVRASLAKGECTSRVSGGLLQPYKVCRSCRCNVCVACTSLHLGHEVSELRIGPIICANKL